MNNEEKIAILKLAIELLEKAEIEKVETVEISHTEYDDGSTGFSVNLSYPAEQKESETFYADNEELIINL